MLSDKLVLVLLMSILATLLLYKNLVRDFQAMGRNLLKKVFQEEITISQYPTKPTITAETVEKALDRLTFEVFGGPFPNDTALVLSSGSFEGHTFDVLSSGAKFFDIGSNKLFIFHAGHLQDAIADDVGGPLFRYAIDHGYSVLLLNMPFGDHSRFASNVNPLTAFIGPVAESVNYALSLKHYDSVTMAGLSGGGWTTVLYSALDTRITKSVPVAGSWPKYLRYKSGDPNSIGDYEQSLPGITLNYLDLYVLATAYNREQLQIFNSNDPCCFAGFDSLSYLDEVKNVSQLVGGIFDIRVVKSNKHEVNSEVFSEIIK